VPVYISPDRPAAARALLAAHPEVDVLVSDDGLQHYALARDVEIAVIDGERRFGNGLLLPSGPLREPVSRLRACDAVVVNGGTPTRCGPRRSSRCARGRALRAPRRTRSATPQEFALMARGRQVVAVAGIGNPTRFFEHSRRSACSARTRLPDHTTTSRGAQAPGAESIVMTEKDAVKCAAFADARMWFMRVEATSPANSTNSVLSRIAQARRSADGPQAA
jgi:tetraacyldisaccharide 4'-kinase